MQSKAPWLWKERHKINPNWWQEQAVLLSTPRSSYLSGEMNGRQSTRITPISPYRKAATAVHWKVIVPAACGGTGGSDFPSRTTPGTGRWAPGQPGAAPAWRAEPLGFLPPPPAPQRCRRPLRGRGAPGPPHSRSLPPSLPSNLVSAGTWRSWWRPEGGSGASPAAAAEARAGLSGGTGRGGRGTGVSVRTRCRLRLARGMWAGTGLSDTAGAVWSCRRPGRGKVRAGEGCGVRPGRPPAHRPRSARPGCPGTRAVPPAERGATQGPRLCWETRGSTRWEGFIWALSFSCLGNGCKHFAAEFCCDHPTAPRLELNGLGSSTLLSNSLSWVSKVQLKYSVCPSIPSFKCYTTLMY